MGSGHLLRSLGGLLLFAGLAAPALAEGSPQGNAAGASGPAAAALASAAAALASAAAQPAAAEKPASPAAPAAPASSGPAPSAWAGTVELYGFAPLRTSGSTTVQGLSTDFDFDLGQVLRALTGMASVRGSVEYSRLGLLTDLSTVSLLGVRGSTTNGVQLSRSLGPGGGGVSVTVPPRSLNANIGFSQGIIDLALRYRIGDRESAVARPGRFSLIPYAGVRFVNLQSSLDLELQGEGSNLTLTGPRGRTLSLNGSPRSFSRYGAVSSSVAQPLLGTQAMVFLAPRLRLFARGDIGGFGIDQPSNLSWNAQAGLGYAIGNSTQLNLSWRSLHLGGSSTETPGNGYILNENGVEIGLKFFL